MVNKYDQINRNPHPHWPSLFQDVSSCVINTYSIKTCRSEGPVVLESPVHPVVEGEATTLSCRDEQASPDLTADFFKDGHLMERNSLNLSILSVSKSNQGVYKCSISGAGESPESWLTVRGETYRCFKTHLWMLCPKPMF